MPTKLQRYAQIADHTAEQLAGSYQGWTDFLTTAARLYKYPYNEQLMIFAQRPDATACAEYDLWNNRMRRYVRRGSRGIALIDTTGDYPKLRYVFDVSDTGSLERSRAVRLWQLRPEYVDGVSAMLERTYDVPRTNGLREQLEAVAAQLADEYWNAHQRDFGYILADSFLEEYDEFNIGVQFRTAATVSITYALMSRCGLEPENYFEHEDFLSIFDFNTPATVAALGTAVSQISQQVLRQIETTIRNLEREQRRPEMAAERTETNDRSDLYPERRLPDSRPDLARAAEEAPGQVRQNAEAVFAGAQAHPLESDGVDGNPVPTLVGDRRGGEQPSGADDARADENGGGDGDTEGQRSHEVDGADEQSESPGRGNHPDGADLRLTDEAPSIRGDQLSFFPSEAEQITSITEAERAENAPSAFSIPQEYIDQFLRMGSNTDNHRTRLAIEYSKQPPRERLVSFVEKTYHGGYGLKFGDTDVCAWYAEDGMHIAYGNSARYATNAQIISWENVAVRIGELLEQGQFATNVELAECRTFEKKQLSEHLWYMSHDMSEKAIEAGYMRIVRSLRGGFPEETEKLMALLSEPESYQAMMKQVYAFRDACAADKSMMRFQIYNPQKLIRPLEEYTLSRREYVSEMANVPEVRGFITEDEINERLSGGSNFSGSKARIYAFYQTPHTAKEKQDFLKKEYGIGGSNNALSHNFHSEESHDGKGIRLDKPNCTRLELSWAKVVKYYDALIESGRLVPPEELEQRYGLENAVDRELAEEQPQSDKAEPRDAAESVPEESAPAAEPEMETTQPSTQELLEQYKPIVNAAVTEDVPYRNACGHSDRENAAIECNAAVRRAVLGSGDMELIRLFSDMPEFRQGLHREVFDETYPKLRELLRPLSQSDIDEALQAWNGDMDSKRRVVRYMETHARDRDTAAWLSREYSGSENKSLFIVRAGSPEEMELPWPKVQRRIAQLIQEDRFYTQTELDNLEDIDPVAIREDLEQRGIVGGQVVDPEKLDRDPFIQQVTADAEQQQIQDTLPDTANRSQDFSSETVAVYPGDKNNLPYDVAIERIHVEQPEYDPPNQVAAENFHITDAHLGEGGPKAKYQANVNAIRLLKELEAEGIQASPEQQEVLSRYVGWGGLADAFDPSKENWSKEFAELKELLTPEEYTAARGSTLNAHYTSPTVINAIYEAVGRMGFQTGNILEPSMGVGNFFGCLPEEMRNSRLYGVELDSITGRIAKQLYPNADITVAGFETTDRRDFYDLAIGNVPFGQYQVNDRAYNKLGFSIHDYFFAKTLDQVRPGGVIAFVTSRYTMDKQSPEVRKYIAQRAELLGAIRLPNNAFKANAGTDVVSDIIFLQKRERPIDIEPDWVHLGKNEDGFAINSYFIDHPEMILGRQSSESTQYGRQDFTVEPIEGLELADQLHDAVKYIRGTYQEAELPDLGEGEEIDTSIPADPNVKNYSYAVVDGEVYYRENSRMVRPELNATAEARVKGLVGLRDCVQELIELQMDAATDRDITEKQAELNRLYDSFSAKYGLINDRGNRLAFSDDSSYYLLCALEVLDEDGKLGRKADMFTKRTIKPHEVVTSVDTASEALALSIAEKACVDLDYMSQLSGRDTEALVSELAGVIFFDPVERRWQTADEYLSGDVREKLRIAREYALPGFPRDGFADYRQNVAALEQAQPKDLDASEIEVRLGATWIDPEDIREFMWETFETPFYLHRSVDVHYSAFTAEWSISGKNAVSYGNINAYMTYGTDRANAYKILEDTLNLRDVRIYDTVTDPDGKERRVLNSKETTLAQQKQQAIKDAFQEWIWKDPDRRQRLVTKYNRLFNSTRPREYDGSHITFGGMNPAITLREHQKSAIAHVLYGGNTLLAHEVGAGKTFEMVAAAMEAKRLGLCQKSLFVVPNHLTEQWASEFLRLYPSANILVTTKKDFDTHNRKKFCARIATGDYDAIIMGHSQFERIPISRERQERLLYEQIDEITEGIAEVQASGGERFTVKQLERTRKSLEARLEKLQAEGRKDDVVTFEQLGVDRLFVDEAHNYKNRSKRCA